MLVHVHALVYFLITPCAANIQLLIHRPNRVSPDDKRDEPREDNHEAMELKDQRGVRGCSWNIVSFLLASFTLISVMSSGGG